MVLTDEQRALLGDYAAAERLTEAGVLLACPYCGGDGMKRGFEKTGAKWITCRDCLCDGAIDDTKRGAIEKWNTRAPILSAEEMEMLERLE